MTGFGAAEGAVAGGRLRVEIRTVNHRFFNFAPKLPSELAALEAELRERLRKDFDRGHVGGVGALGRSTRSARRRWRSTCRAREAAAARLAGAASRRSASSGEVTLELVARQPEVLVTTERRGDRRSPGPRSSRSWRRRPPSAGPCGAREGAALGAELLAPARPRSRRVRAIIAERAPERLVRERDRLRASVAQLLDGPAGGRAAAGAGDRASWPTSWTSPRSWCGSARTSRRVATALAGDRPVGQAARLPGAGAGARGEHDGLEGERRRDRAGGHRHEGGAGEVPRAAREPRVTPFLLVLSSPSGGGKTTIARQLLGDAARPGVLGLGHDAAAAAGRAGRASDYHFLPRDEFDAPGRRPASSSSGRSTAATSTARCGPRSSGSSRRAGTWCSTSRCRARGRCGGRSRPRCRSSCCRRRPRSLVERLGAAEHRDGRGAARAGWQRAARRSWRRASTTT